MEQVWEIPRFAMLMLSFSKRLDVGSEERWRERTPGFDAWEYLKYLLRLRSALLQSQIAGHFEVGWIYSCVVFSAASLSESSFGELHVYFILRWTCNSAISLHIISLDLPLCMQESQYLLSFSGGMQYSQVPCMVSQLARQKVWDS